MRRPLRHLALAVCLTGAGCAHHHITERQITIAVVTGVGIGLAVWLLATACDLSAASCQQVDRSPGP